MLNHVAVLGTAFGLGLVGWALLKKSEELKKVSLGVFVIVALLAIPAYLTGEPAEELVEDLPGVSETFIEQHEEAAQVAFAGVLIVGAAALGGLIFFRRGKNWLSVIVLVLSLIVFVLMARTANLGGLIRHMEIRADFYSPVVKDENAS